MATPGVLFICRALPILLSPLALSYAGTQLIETHLHLKIPTSAKALCILAVYCGTLTCSVQWRSFRKKREARRLGAKPIPILEGSWIGNVDRMLELVRTFDTSYLG